MINSIKELCNILLKEEQLHDELIMLAKGMKEAIITKKREIVTKLTRKYDDITIQIIDLENSRLKISDKIACELLSDPIHLNLREIIGLISDEKVKNKLTIRRSELKKRITEFSRLNMANSILLREKIKDIDCNVRIIVENSRKPAAYSSKGMMQNGKNSTKLFNQVG